MKKLSLLFFAITIKVYSVHNIVMNDVVLANYTLLQGTKMCKYEYSSTDNKVYFANSNRHLISVDFSATTPIITDLTAITIGGVLDIADNSDLSTDGTSVFFKERTTGRIGSYWSDGTNWYCSLLSTSFQPVASGGAIFLDDKKRLFYNGSDKKIYQLNRTKLGWTSVALPTPWLPISATSDIYGQHDHLFYFGTDNKLYEYYYTGIWNPSFPCPNVPVSAVGSNISMDESDNVYFTGSDLKVYCISWNGQNGWSLTLVNSTLARPTASPKYQLNCGKIFYADASSNAISYLFYNGGSWAGHTNIYANSLSTLTNYSNGTNSDILVNNNGDILYQSADDSYIHILSPKIIWKDIVVAGGLTASESNVLIAETTLYKKMYPEDYKFYPRNSSNVGIAPCQGNGWGNYKITFKLEKTDYFGNVSTVSTQTFDIDQQGDFQASVSLNAELSEYKIYYMLNGQNRFTVLADKLVCGDAYIASGQSNMQASDGQMNKCNMNNNFGSTTGSYAKYSRSYGGAVQSGNGIRTWGRSSFNNDVTQYWSFEHPVGGIILPLQYKLQQQFGIPTCVLNAAIGSTKIDQHQLNASNKFYYEFAPSSNVPANNISGHLMRRIYAAGLENDIKGFFWYQGEGDIDPNYMAGTYKTKFKQLYDDLAANIPSLSSSTTSKNTKTYLFQMHSQPTLGYSIYPSANLLAEDQRTMASYIPYANITVIPTNGVHYPNCANIHFTEQAYEEICDRVLKVMGMQLYNASYNVNNMPLQIVSAVRDNTNNTLTLEFNQNLYINSPDNMNSVLSNINLSNGTTKSNAVINSNKITFQVGSSTNLNTLNYLGDMRGCHMQSPGCLSTPISSTTCSPGTNSQWSYAWWCDGYLRNVNGDAALSCYNFPILTYCPSCYRSSGSSSNENISADGMQLYPNPVQTELHLKTDTPVIELSVVDLLGNVKTIDHSDNREGEIIINVADLSSGSYMLVVKTEKGVVNKKINIIR